MLCTTSGIATWPCIFTTCSANYYFLANSSGNLLFNLGQGKLVKHSPQQDTILWQRNLLDLSRKCLGSKKASLSAPLLSSLGMPAQGTYHTWPSPMAEHTTIWQNIIPTNFYNVNLVLQWLNLTAIGSHRFCTTCSGSAWVLFTDSVWLPIINVCFTNSSSFRPALTICLSWVLQPETSQTVFSMVCQCCVTMFHANNALFDSACRKWEHVMRQMTKTVGFHNIWMRWMTRILESVASDALNNCNCLTVLLHSSQWWELRKQGIRMITRNTHTHTPPWITPHMW